MNFKKDFNYGLNHSLVLTMINGAAFARKSDKDRDTLSLTGHVLWRGVGVRPL